MYFNVGDITKIHCTLEQIFPQMEKGIYPEKKPLLQAIIEKPNLILFGNKSPYQDIISKAAVMMEAITRWHIFVDGNKRTGLMTAFLYLYLNGTYFAIPIDSVKFTIIIASNKKTDPESTNKLIQAIAEWLKKHSTTDERMFRSLVWKYNSIPKLKITILRYLGFKKKVKNILNGWYALDTHPEYIEEANETTVFLQRMTKLAIKNIFESIRVKKKKKSKQ